MADEADRDFQAGKTGPFGFVQLVLPRASGRPRCQPDLHEMRPVVALMFHGADLRGIDARMDQDVETCRVCGFVVVKEAARRA